jgi:hypothetical protein
MEVPNHATDLFERYLQAVRKYLPAQRQDDIVAELRANLDAQREEREAGLGRPLTEGEMIDWLTELGPPMRMAARYQPSRYLIGPAIFPLYWQILRIVLIWATVAYAVATVLRTFTEPHGPEWIAQALFGYPQLLFSAAACVTIAFAILELVSERYPEKCPPFLATSSHWSPTSLPPLEKEPALQGKPRTLTTAVANFVVGFVVLIWLLLLPRYPYLVLGPGAAFLHRSPFQFAPVVIWFYWAVVGLQAFQLTWQGYDLLAEKWRTKHPLHMLASKALGVTPTAILIGAPGQIYLTLNPGASSTLPGGVQVQVATINHYIFVSCVVIAFIVIIDFAVEVWKASKAARQHQFHTVL